MNRARLIRIRALQRRAALADVEHAAAQVARSDERIVHIDQLTHAVAPDCGVHAGAQFSSASECAARLRTGRLAIASGQVALMNTRASAQRRLCDADSAERGAARLTELASGAHGSELAR